MSNRVPIFGDKRLRRWRDNLIASPFEVKLLPLVFVILGAMPFSFLFTDDNTAKIVRFVTLQGGAIFFSQAAIQSFRLVFGDQSVGKQILVRLGIIAMLLTIVLFDRFEPPSYFVLHSPAQVVQQAHFYRPIYNQAIPLVAIAILLIRLVPLTVKYYKQKREKKQLMASGIN